MEAPQRAGATLESGDGSLGFDAGFRLPVSLPGDDIMKAESSIADLLRFQGLGAEPDIPTSSFSCTPFSQRRKVISMTAVRLQSPVNGQRNQQHLYLHRLLHLHLQTSASRPASASVSASSSPPSPLSYRRQQMIVSIIVFGVLFHVSVTSWPSSTAYNMVTTMAMFTETACSGDRKKQCFCQPPMYILVLIHIFGICDGM